LSNILGKISRAADAFAEVITEDLRSDNTVKMYRYSDFKELFISKRKEYPQICKCTISIQQGKQFDDMVFAGNKYIIRIVMLEESKRPICAKGTTDEYVGALVIADGIDKALKDFMGEKTEKTVVMGGK
jgi:hypothetical protein